ncbi:AraC family transcriptional regulator ligand-binding domain-containing protein [Variovorax sp. UC122_21]|uniref:AraC family transcriptional regulator ligand-binding domain-containing protein n=1 Tax=Variovorax sp. UC122_21 TaxID=3374554 RepID=UPI00375657FC
MLQPPVTIPVAFVEGMLSGIRARGAAAPIDIDRALEDAGVPPPLLSEPGARVTAEQYVALFALLMDRLDDESLCFLNAPDAPRQPGADRALHAGAPDFGHALRRVAHTFSLLQDDLRLVLLREGELAGFGIAIENPAIGHQNFLHELMLRVYWRLLAWLHGGRLAARRFDFGFALPPYAAGYARCSRAPCASASPARPCGSTPRHCARQCTATRMRSATSSRPRPAT